MRKRCFVFVAAVYCLNEFNLICVSYWYRMNFISLQMHYMYVCVAFFICFQRLNGFNFHVTTLRWYRCRGYYIFLWFQLFHLDPRIFTVALWTNWKSSKTDRLTSWSWLNMMLSILKIAIQKPKKKSNWRNFS